MAGGGNPQAVPRGDPGPLSSTSMQGQGPAHKAQQLPSQRSHILVSFKPCWPVPDVQQCSSATYTPANGTTISSVLVKMLFSAGCKSTNLHFHPYCTDATLNKGKTNIFLNTAFRFAEVPSFPHWNSSQRRYFSICSSPSFIGKCSFGPRYKCSAQLATAANGLLMTTRVGSAIPGWEVCSTWHLPSSTQPFAAFNGRWMWSDGITLDFSL